MTSLSRLKHSFFYGWVIIASLLIINTAFSGARFSFGIFFKSIESEFSLSRATTSTVFSSYALLCCVFAILGGWAIDKYGSRVVVLFMGVIAGLSLVLTGQTSSLWQLFITYSLLLAIGTGAAHAMEVATLSKWFDEKLGMALGITRSGVGLGAMLVAPLAAYVISNFSWRISYVVLGAIIWLLIIPLSGLLRNGPYGNEILRGKTKSDLAPGHIKGINDGDVLIRPVHFSLMQAFRTRNFWLLIFIFAAHAFSTFLVMTHMVPHVTDIGFSEVEAATSLSLVGAAIIAGTIIMGIVSDKIGRKATVIICLLILCGSMLWLIWAHELWAIYLFALVFGFAAGGFGASLPALIGETFGLGSIGVIVGFMDASHG
ncbi:MFS transporter, partial [Chloroflexota bacterium]